jgi:hypothetical protein
LVRGLPWGEKKRQPEAALRRRPEVSHGGERKKRVQAHGVGWGAALPVLQCAVLQLAKPKTTRGGYRGVARGSCPDVILRHAAKNNSDGVHAKTP